MIVVELFSDLGEQFVHLTVLAELFFGLAAFQANLLLICLIQQAPAIFLGHAAGRWVNRMGLCNGIVGGNLVRLLLVVGLLLARGQWCVWPIYLLFAIASLVFVIARLCITPRIVAPTELIGYNALNERVALAAGIGGPFLIGLLISRAGSGMALAMGMAMYGCSAWLAMGLPRVHSPVDKECEQRQTGWWHRLARAYLEPVTDSRIGTWAVLMLAAGMIGGVLNFGAPVYNRMFFKGDIVAWGAVMSGYQAGACLATFLLPALAGRLTDRTLLVASFTLVGVGFVLLTVLPWLALFVMVMACLGCLFTLLAMFLTNRIQRDCAEFRRGEILAGLTALGGMCLLAGNSTAALVVKVGGVQLLLSLGAGLSMAAMPVAWGFSYLQGAREEEGTQT